MEGASADNATSPLQHQPFDELSPARHHPAMATTGKSRRIVAGIDDVRLSTLQKSQSHLGRQRIDVEQIRQRGGDKARQRLSGAGSNDNLGARGSLHHDLRPFVQSEAGSLG
jgi:hypothetical protein